MKVPVLFYADDGLLMARTEREAEQMVELLEDSAGRCGMRINKEKSKCLIFGGRDERCDDVGGIGVVEEMRYLGVMVEAKRNCFRSNKEEKLGIAKKMANVTYSVVT